MTHNLLKSALFANAVFSGSMGLVALGLAAPLAEALGPPAWSLRSIGAGLIVFAAAVSRQARTSQMAGTSQIIAADLAWVIVAAILIASTPSWLTAAGSMVLTAVTTVVAALAAAQWRGLAALS